MQNQRARDLERQHARERQKDIEDSWPFFETDGLIVACTVAENNQKGSHKGCKTHITSAGYLWKEVHLHQQAG